MSEGVFILGISSCLMCGHAIEGHQRPQHPQLTSKLLPTAALSLSTVRALFRAPAITKTMLYVCREQIGTESAVACWPGKGTHRRRIISTNSRVDPTLSHVSLLHAVKLNKRKREQCCEMVTWTQWQEERQAHLSCVLADSDQTIAPTEQHCTLSRKH